MTLATKKNPTPEGILEPAWTEYEVWLEGYAATGEHGDAQTLGTYKAVNFGNAVIAAMIAKTWEWEHFSIRDDGRFAYWACRFYDNEEDARRSFG